MPFLFHSGAARLAQLLCAPALVLLLAADAAAQSPLAIGLTQPALGRDSILRTTEATITIAGQVTGGHTGRILYIDTKPRSMDADGRFSVQVELQPGENRIPIGAYDQRKGKALFLIVVHRDPAGTAQGQNPVQPPKIDPPPTPPPPDVHPPQTTLPPEEEVEDADALPEPEESINVHALIIGISRYANDSKINLQFARKDALAFHDFVTSEKGLAADPRNVRLLLDENATRVAILTSLKDMMNSARQEDVFMLYFSGHGEQVGNSREFCFFTYDAITRDPDQLEASAVLQSEVMRQMEFNKTGKKVLFLDACYSGLMAAGGKGASGHHVELMRRMAETDRTMTILTSSSDSERSYEDPSLAGGHGIFTYYLIKGLEGAADKARDGNTDGYVTVYELDRYLSDEVNARALATHKARQRPKRVCDRCEDFPLSRAGEYDVDKASPARVSTQTITTAPVAVPPTPQQPVAEPSGTGRNYSIIRLPPAPEVEYTPPANPKILNEVIYADPATGDKITLHGHHYSDVQISGILGGMIISAPGKINGDMITFSDDDPRSATKESFLNLSPDWSGMKVTLNLPAAPRRTYQLTRLGVAKREKLLGRRFRSEDGNTNLCVFHHHYSDIAISGHVGDNILYASGRELGDVLEFVDKDKEAYATGRFVLSDDWSALLGHITYKDGRVQQVNLPLSGTEPGYELNNSKYLNSTGDQTVNFYGAHYAEIKLSGIVGDDNVVCVGKVQGDVVLMNQDPKDPKFLPSRLLLRDKGAVLRGTIGFKDGAGAYVIIDMKRALP